ncbi:type II toxin-antitoxin system RelE/ParE family toxin [Pedobacter sp. BS3]|uniref:type II toxin-antitoxin system RelE/ParE family toxin n=1 Tax=Pedobacter sp. BS3 TaxID=2567937 RepID=UPI0011F01BE4|nr:type II toxin-antitoxin system RelE/ParE family toxin [Pedobacter sp. BS3]
MGLPIYYTETFEVTFKMLIEFIRENWGEKVAREFVRETEKIIQMIANFPHMYKSGTFDKNVRIAPINRLSLLFYEVTSKHIMLHYIVDSRQEPFWL